MNKIKLGLKMHKLKQKIPRPLKIIFGTEEGIFFMLMLATLISFMSGFKDLAIIISVYNVMLGVSGMLKYRDSSGSTDRMGDIEDMMAEGLEMAEQFQDDVEGEEQA